MSGVQIPNWVISLILALLCLVSIYAFVKSCGAWCVHKWRGGSGGQSDHQKIKNY
jgi:hypothetical protein